MDELNQMYQEFNKRFWSGRLPKYRVVYRRLPGAKHGYCRSEKRTIEITRGTTGEEPRRILLHEMCHIGCPGHGKKFQAKLTRLASLGEQWATAEAEMYREAQPYHVHMSNLRGTLDDVAGEAASQNKTPRFRDVLAWCAADFGETPGNFQKKVPWFKNAWRNAVRNARQQGRRK